MAVLLTTHSGSEECEQVLSEQVFGPALWLWWLPLHTQASRPTGDGVHWRMLYSHAIDEDELVDEMEEPLNPPTPRSAYLESSRTPKFTTPTRAR